MSKQKRARLFKRGRVYFRQLAVLDGNHYSKDVGYLWVAHTKHPFLTFPKNGSQQEFADHLFDLSQQYQFLIAEDRNKEFKETGPIGLVWVFDDGWRIEPHVEFFSWATPRNKLNAVVSFIQLMRYRTIGVIMIYALQESMKLFDKASEYGVLRKVGRIIKGDPRGDQWLYSMEGAKHVGK